MGKELDRINKKIDELNIKIKKLNDACAAEVVELIGGTQSRILSYNQQQEIKKSIDSHTKQLAKLMADLEDMELLRDDAIKNNK